ncbi:MAG: ROK family protein [Pyrinomonadaceae bacterium]|nr:ROK family protein [Acidobacteriota bacterium]
MNEIVLAADLGGTNLRMAAVDSDGKVLYRTGIETPRSENHKPIVASLIQLAIACREATKKDASVTAFGIAVPAIINTCGKIFNAPNLPELNGLEFSSAIASKIGVQVIVENDATAAAIGENWMGASRDFGSSICVTLGTGVGGGIVIDGKPLRGIDGTAGEIGHICVEPDGVKCGCGSFGCLEQYSSASAITRMAVELRDRYPKSLLRNKTGLGPLDIFNAGKSGDALAIEVFRRVGYYLGIAFAGLVNVLNPEVIVIGGGASAGWELFIDEVLCEIRKRAFKQPAERVRVVRAELGDDAGILGAARLALGK